MGKLLDIVIVNWNAGDLLSQCLKSIKCYGHNETRRVIVLDNASTDGSADGISDLYELPLEVVRNNANYGFARACNQGAELGKAPYLLFLNPDIRLFAHSLSIPLAFMEKDENKEVGICGIQLVNESDEVARTCARSPSLGRLTAPIFGFDKCPGLEKWGMRMMDWDHMGMRAVDHIMGAFFLVRRELFERLGGFDERFFVYFEDVDFCVRVRNAGYRCMYIGDARAHHAGGGTSQQIKAMRLFYSLRSRLLFGFKHFSPPRAWALALTMIGAEPVSRFLFCAVQRNWEGIRDTMEAYRLLWQALPRIVSGRSVRGD